MISTLLTLFIVGFVALIAIGIILSLLGVAVGLLFKLAPILLLGYLVVRFLSPKKKTVTEEDEEWLKS
jgi:small basic protein